MISGACFCKAVQYELLTDSQMQGLCYCTDCQVWAGAPIGPPMPCDTRFPLDRRRVSFLYLRSRIRKASDPLLLWGLWHPDQGAV